MGDPVIPSVSLVIPTHNRHDSLKRTLDGLSKQSFPLHKLEVVVAADGCTDNTLQMLRHYKAPFALRVVEQSGQGAATARNAGATGATGDFLLFLDDDIEASPHLIEAHMTAHVGLSDGVVIGYVPPIMALQRGFFRIKLREWWENMFQLMSQKDHRFNYRDLLSGNFSLSRKLFQQVSGFNTSFKCQEDYELGVRLIKANANLVFEPRALGYHHEVTDLDRSLQRKFAEGKAAVLFSQTYPELIDTQPLFAGFAKGYSRSTRGQLLLIYNFPRIGDLMARTLRVLLNVLETLKMRGRWNSVLGRLLSYWYLRGVAESTKSFTALNGLLRNSNKPGEAQKGSLLSIDIQKGLEQAEERINSLRPAGIQIWYGRYLVGTIAAKAGFEKLRSVHLRSALAKSFAYPLTEAIAFSNETGVVPFSGSPEATMTEKAKKYVH